MSRQELREFLAITIQNVNPELSREDADLHFRLCRCQAYLDMIERHFADEWEDFCVMLKNTVKGNTIAEVAVRMAIDKTNG